VQRSLDSFVRGLPEGKCSRVLGRDSGFVGQTTRGVNLRSVPEESEIKGRFVGGDSRLPARRRRVKNETTRGAGFATVRVRGGGSRIRSPATGQLHPVRLHKEAGYGSNGATVCVHRIKANYGVTAGSRGAGTHTRLFKKGETLLDPLQVLTRNRSLLSKLAHYFFSSKRRLGAG